ncbi:MAG TPA: LmeA family phospholipid-binding protein [Acidimicrobiales bacterium]|nr:LmeA family phospholipid-binding protein [Acidimicrobiales bacterium]
MLKKLLLFFLLLIVGAYGVLDVAAKRMAEQKLAERAEASAGGQAEATADVDSFPFVLKLLARGSAGDISIHVTDVTASQLEFTSVDLDLRGVKLDKGKLLADRRPEVTDIDTGTLTIRIAAAAISKALRGLPVTISDGRVEVEVAGQVRTADVTLAAGGALRIGVPRGPSVTVQVPRTALGSCDATALNVDNDMIRLSCTMTEIPPALLAAAQR